MHGPNPGYIPGDYWMCCDSCGFDYRRSRMKKRWDGLWVCGACWEPRHPQDFLRGKKDRQAVPVARPAINAENTTTTLSAGASAGSTTIPVTSATGIYEGDGIGVTLDEGWVFQTFVDSIAGTTVTLNNPLYSAAASGNTVYVSGAGSHFLQTDITASDL